jgi:hypothetical protein
MTESVRARITRIRRRGYAYRETAPFYVWDSRLKNPCGYPVEGFASLCRLLLRCPHLYATSHHLT